MFQMNCVITGATSGIGRAAARRLAALGANLVIVGRNARAGTDVERALRRLVPAAKVAFIQADLSNPTDVRRIAADVGERFPHLDVLINNAGARFDTCRMRPDGVELTFATNHLGHFLLTCLLYDSLVRAGAARVITVASGSHHAANTADGWFPTRPKYDRRLAYANSKLANVLFGYELARRVSRTTVTSNIADPGGVATNFARNNGVVPWVRHLMAHALARDLISPVKAAEGIVYLAISEEVKGVNGKYFYRGRVVESSSDSRNLEAARQLWDLSIELSGVGDRLPTSLVART
jgi:NAD(P)-dependent dehydrogenase (short-subunit alcohol dehydrogenase family)